MLTRITSEALKKKIDYLDTCIFQKFQDKFTRCIWILKVIKIFLLNGSFGDTEFYYFLLTDHETVVLK